VALVLLSAGLFNVLAILAIQINAPWMTAPDTWVWNWFDAHRSPRWQVHADGIFGYIGEPFHAAAFLPRARRDPKTATDGVRRADARV
jgi:undecaprenyl-diphosphatase